jgi:uncharacterized protein (DUF2147 family)
MRYFSILLLLVFCWLNVDSQSNDKADAICGKWMSAEKNLAVEVYRNQGTYKAKIIYFTGGVTKDNSMETITDTKNPNPALRNRKVLGLNVLEGLTFNGSSWENGTIYEVQSGKYWSAAAHLDNDGLLKVKGYWHVKLLGKTMTFRRM